MKKLTKKQWSERGIHNPHNIASVGVGVYVSYCPQETGRGYRSAKWQVARIGYKTDPKAHWTDKYCKTWNVYNVKEDKERLRLEAIEWASKRYKIDEWERDPWGDWHPKGSMEKAAKKETGENI